MTEPSSDAASNGAAAQARLMRLATFASVSVASVLIAIKLMAWTLTGSVSMLSSLMDSILDAAASLLNMLAVRHALEPPDAEHRFGHGKAEALSALGQGIFLTASGVFLAVQAIDRLMDPQPVSQGTLGLTVMAVSILLTLGLVLFQRSVLKRTRSLAIDADHLHYKGDLLVNVGVMLAIALSSGLIVQDARLWYVDPIMGLAIAAYILANAWSILRGSFDELMDRELPDDARDRIASIVRKHPDVLGMHDLRTRSSGRATFIQLHIEMDPRTPLHKAHAVAEQVAQHLRATFPGADVIVHQDPHEGQAAPDRRLG
jgi:ferrous-iron efflux pump FieF